MSKILTVYAAMLLLPGCLEEGKTGQKQQNNPCAITSVAERQPIYSLDDGEKGNGFAAFLGLLTLGGVAGNILIRRRRRAENNL